MRAKEMRLHGATSTNQPLQAQTAQGSLEAGGKRITASTSGFGTPFPSVFMFVDSGITGETILKIALCAVPFVLCMYIVAMLHACIPAMSMTLLPKIQR